MATMVATFITGYVIYHLCTSKKSVGLVIKYKDHHKQ